MKNEGLETLLVHFVFHRENFVSNSFTKCINVIKINVSISSRNFVKCKNADHLRISFNTELENSAKRKLLETKLYFYAFQFL